MAKEKFKDIWNKYSKLDKFGFITYHILLITYILMLIYYGYIDTKIIEMFRLTYDGINTTIFHFIALLSMAFGFYSLSIGYGYIVEKIFYPETKDEIIIKNKRKEFKRKYPIKLAIKKLKELKLELKLGDIKEDIKELKNG